jgi:hypothetical protein
VKTTEPEVKPIEELTLPETVARINEITQRRAEVKAIEGDLEELIKRAYELFTPVEEMNVVQLKDEVMRLDAIYCDVIKPFYERQKATYDMLVSFTGPGFEWEGDTVTDEDAGIHWQDERGLVWATERKTGTFVEFKDFGVTRTRDLDRDEVKGLSMTKARKLGYVVEGK